MGARRGKGNVKRPCLPDEIFILCAEPSLSSLAFSLTELNDNLAASVLILVVGVGVDLADELIDALLDEGLKINVLYPRDGDV